MAIVRTFTKQMPTRGASGALKISALYKRTDDGVEAFSITKSLDYRPGQDLALKYATLAAQFNDAEEEYDMLLGYFDHAKMDGLLTYLENNVTGG